jgi:serine O-acetyltransferase
MAITQHRIAHQLNGLGVPLIPRIISELAHSATGIDIHPGAAIGRSFFIDHGTGVVIGETCSIGERVRIYQGVTLGARGFPTDDDGHPVKGLPRHPVVEDDVVVYAGATILGHITIGKGATIGGNVWLTRSVAPGTRVTQAQYRHDTFEAGSGI